MMRIASFEGVFSFRFRNFRLYGFSVGGLLNELFILGKIVVLFGNQGLGLGSRFRGNKVNARGGLNGHGSGHVTN